MEIWEEQVTHEFGWQKLSRYSREHYYQSVGSLLSTNSWSLKK